MSSLPVRALLVDDEPLARERLRVLLAAWAEMTVVGEASGGAAAVEAIRTHRPDLVFLDIQMPEVDGFEVIRRIGPALMPPVILVTAYEQYALRAFEVHALDYLLKPFDRERFASAVARALQRHDDRDRNIQGRLVELLDDLERSHAYRQRLVIKQGARVTFLSVDEINWVEAADNYVKLHAGRHVHVMRATMNHLERLLDPKRFARIHRSTLVALDQIREIQPWFNGDYAVILADGTKLTSSRRYRRALDHLTRDE